MREDGDLDMPDLDNEDVRPTHSCMFSSIMPRQRKGNS